MKRKLLYIALLFSLMLPLVTGCFLLWSRQLSPDIQRREQILAINEIEQLALSGDLELMSQRVSALQDTLRSSGTNLRGDLFYFVICGIGILFVFVILGYVYLTILRPFDKLSHFAQQVAAGNLDLPLQQERSNYFGAFTWAFDHMRREIARARTCEQTAIAHNKTIIATLSHDIKTPIASIRAYAEGLEAHMDTSSEKRQQYLNVIINKCDQVSALTNDLFLHSLTDLDKLQINPDKLELSTFLKDTLSEFTLTKQDIRYQIPDFQAFVVADPKRLTQIIENIIFNARKYAKPPIEVSLCETGGNVELHFRDYGPGIPDPDMPFVRDKFYRGRNCGSEPGSGLGLYIVDYITKKMGGTLLLHNHRDGLEVIISLPFSGS